MYSTYGFDILRTYSVILYKTIIYLSPPSLHTLQYFSKIKELGQLSSIVFNCEFLQL